MFLLQAIPSHSARRSLFEHYVKTRAEEERKEKRAAQRAAIEGFKQLLEEASEVLWINFFSKAIPFWANISCTLLLLLKLESEDCSLLTSQIFYFRILIKTLIIKLSERSGAMIRGLRL